MTDTEGAYTENLRKSPSPNVADIDGDMDKEHYHGPYCGFEIWQQQSAQQDGRNLELWLGKIKNLVRDIGDLGIQLTANVGAVLTPPSVLLVFRRRGRSMFGQFLELATYIWRPPWFDRSWNLQTDGRRVEVERDKRKPPWRFVGLARKLE